MIENYDKQKEAYEKRGARPKSAHPERGGAGCGARHGTLPTAGVGGCGPGGRLISSPGVTILGGVHGKIRDL